MSSSLRTRAIVLARTQVRDTDLLITLLTDQFGKITCFARGARNSKKRFMGGLDLFDCGMFELSRSRKNEEFYSLEGISEREVWIRLREGLQKFSVASLIVETVNTMTAEGDLDSHFLYSAVHWALRQIDRAESDDELFAAATKALLTVLEIAGIDPLEASLPISTDSAGWLTILDKGDELVLPSDRALINECLLALIRFIEDSLGHALRSNQPALIHALSAFTRKVANVGR